jgi:acyl carrier protein
MSHATTFAEIKRILREAKPITDDVLLEVAKLAIGETLGEREDELDSPIGWDSKLGDDLMLDSLDMVELVMFLEECFAVEIPDEDAVDIITVGNALEVIKRNKKNAPSKRKKVNKKAKIAKNVQEQIDAKARAQKELDDELEKALDEN